MKLKWIEYYSEGSRSPFRRMFNNFSGILKVVVIKIQEEISFCKYEKNVNEKNDLNLKQLIVTFLQYLDLLHYQTY